MNNKEIKINPTTEKELDKFIEDNSGIWDLTDVKEFLIYHKDEVIKILIRLHVGDYIKNF